MKPILAPTLKAIFALCLTVAWANSLSAQVEVLPPDFMLFDKTSGEYCAEWNAYFVEHSTNGDYLFPDAGPFSDERVYFLERLPFYFPTLGLQTYFVPDDVYVHFPIISRAEDNTYVIPPLRPEELRDSNRAAIASIIDVHAVIDGVPVANPLSYRTESPLFSYYFATTDNYYNQFAGQAFLGLVEPVIAGGYLLMTKPLPVGLHDVQTGYTFGEPNGFTRERHYQIISLPAPQFLAHQMEKLLSKMTNSLVAGERRQPLLATPKAAKRSFTSGDLRAGINQLRAFEKIVKAQLAGTYPELAAVLTQSAEQIIAKAAARLK